jgi:rhodanese-related sulfurtransferase
MYNIVTDLNNALPGNSSVYTAQHAPIEEALFSEDPTDAPIDWLDNDHVICVYCRSMSVPPLYK